MGESRLTRQGNEIFSHKKAVVHYDICDAEIILSGGENGEIPLVMTKKTPYGKTAFFNLPPTVVKRESFRERYGHGQRSMSHVIEFGIQEYLPAAGWRSRRKCRTRSHFCLKNRRQCDIVVILSEDSPIYGDTTSYPASFRFTVREPGIGKMKIESDAEYTVIRIERMTLLCYARKRQRMMLCFFDSAKMYN